MQSRKYLTKFRFIGTLKSSTVLQSRWQSFCLPRITVYESKQYVLALMPTRLSSRSSVHTQYDIYLRCVVLSEQPGFVFRKDYASHQITEVLRRAKLPRSNLTKNMKDAVRNLRADKSIHILKADKGYATVVLDRVEYDKSWLF